MSNIRLLIEMEKFAKCPLSDFEKATIVSTVSIKEPKLGGAKKAPYRRHFFFFFFWFLES